VGQSQVDQVESWLFQMALHLLKAEAWPLSTTVPALARRSARASVPKRGGSTEPAWRRRLICPAYTQTPCKPCQTRLTARRPCLCGCLPVDVGRSANRSLRPTHRLQHKDGFRFNRRSEPDERPLRHRLSCLANEQAELLRAGQLKDADVANIAEEIESMGRANGNQ